MNDEELGLLCRPWPGTHCDIKWEHNRVWSVGGKMFCLLALDMPHGGQLSVKVASARFLELTDVPGVLPAPYLARAHWICLAPGHALSAAEIEGLVRDAYCLVRERLPRRIRDQLEPLPALR